MGQGKARRGNWVIVFADLIGSSSSRAVARGSRLTVTNRLLVAPLSHLVKGGDRRTDRTYGSHRTYRSQGSTIHEPPIALVPEA